MNQRLLDTGFSHISFLGEKLLYYPQNLLEIVILAVLLYYTILFIRGTRAVAVLRGAVFLVVLFGIAEVFRFHTISLLYRRLANLVVFSFIVLFAPELRRALIAIGRQTFVRRVIGTGEYVLPICDAVRELTNRNIGALIAVERTVGLRGYIRTEGTTLDAEISSKALVSIFYPKSPLHDGGVIIENGRILAAGCIFPLCASPMSHHMGTRHRAALAMSEETDALVICISEETGKISLFEEGVWSEGVSVKEVERQLTEAGL